MYEKKTTIKNKLGLHARPAALIVQTATKHKSDVAIIKGDTLADGKSIMSIMMLAAEPGVEITIRADGDDETEVVDTILQLVDNRFNED